MPDAPLSFNQRLFDFLNASPTPFHATREVVRLLEARGFTRLVEADRWQLKAQGRYFVTRNDSSVVAFQVGNGSVADQGFRIAGSHTDSPCLRVKPTPDLLSQQFHQLSTEIYGGALLGTWFDRDLSLAGRITFKTSLGKIEHALIDFKKPIAVLPNLAIHLNREVNDKRSIQRQTEMNPILSLWDDRKSKSFQELLLDHLKSQGHSSAIEILEHEISAYDTQPAAVVGLREEFMTSARLDNLLSVFVGTQAMLEAAQGTFALFVAHDHEEVGSQSSHGADSTFVRSLLERIASDNETLHRAVDRSFFVSMDNAHGVHPNYSDRHDPLHKPLLNRGPAIKTNVSQRYATNSETAGVFIHLCQELKVPYQKFVSRNDQPCGSTIGPISSSQLGIRTVDVGIPTFAMHSVRELAGTEDSYSLFQIIKEYFSRPSLS